MLCTLLCIELTRGKILEEKWLNLSKVILLTWLMQHRVVIKLINGHLEERPKDMHTVFIFKVIDTSYETNDNSKYY